MNIEKNSSAPDTQSAKWQLTINNPDKSGMTHECIKAQLHSLKSLKYYCIADEKGSTPHTHVFIAFSSGVRFSTMKNKFAAAHIEVAKGSCEQNRNYILKSGKWETDEKHDTVIEGSFEEFGDLPDEHQGRRSDLAAIFELLKDGISDREILELYPHAMIYLDKLERTRQIFNSDEYSKTFRNITVTYIVASPNINVTRLVLELYDFNAYVVTDYVHPFDGYRSEDVLVFDNFDSQLPLSDMRTYLNGNPVNLPCRYLNKIACYTKVFFVSYLDPNGLYPHDQQDNNPLYKTFIELIDEIINFDDATSHVSSLHEFGGVK